MSSSVDEQPVHEVEYGGRVYRWQGTLREFTSMQVSGGDWVTLHSLISQTNGGILDVLAEAGF